MKKIKEVIKEIGTLNCIIVVVLLIMGITMTSVMLGVEEKLESFEDTLYQQENLPDSNEEKETSENKMGLFEIRKTEHGSYGLGLGYIFLIPVIIIGVIVLKRYKKEVQAADIPQEYLNEFEELYNKLYKENSNYFEKARKINILKKIICIVVIIFSIVILLNNMAFAPLALCGVFIFIILNSVMKNSKYNNKFIDDFKLNIVEPIIKLALPNAIYTPKDGISRAKYAEVDWDHYDSFESEDLIEGKIKLEGNNNFEIDITMSEVYTTYETSDSEGNTYTHKSFSGLVAYTTLPENIGCELHVFRGKSRASNLKVYTTDLGRLYDIENDDKMNASQALITDIFSRESRVSNLKVDMTEFEKLYDIETDDKIKAMQILTADIMVDIVELTNKCKVDFRFDIQNDKLYFKFYTEKMFEPQTFNKKMEKMMLKKYYNVVRMCVKISKEICEIILNANI